MDRRPHWLADPVFHVILIIASVACLGAWRSSIVSRLEGHIVTLYEPRTPWPGPERAAAAGVPAPLRLRTPG